jgi:hypothetical protein
MLLVRCPRRRSPGNSALLRPVGCVRVFNCLLFGTKGCGKTQLLHMLAGSKFSPLAASATPASGLQGACFIPGREGVPDTVCHSPRSPCGDPCRCYTDTNTRDCGLFMYICAHFLALYVWGLVVVLWNANLIHITLSIVFFAEFER